MAIDLDAIRKKLNQLSGVNSKRRTMWRPTEGEESVVRIIGFTDNDGNPFKERYFYYNIGNNPGFLAPFQFGKPDPFQELIDKLKSEGSKESYELAKKLYPKMRVYAAVVVRGQESEGVKLWGFGKQVYQALLNVMLDPDYGDITDLGEGHDIKLMCTKQPGRMWTTTEVRVRPKATALGTKSEVKEWTANMPDLDSIYTLEPYEKLESAINAWLNGGDEEDNTDTSTPEHRRYTSDKSSSKSQTKATSKPATDTSQLTKTYDDLDEAFADLDDDMGF
jgi:hypothetical protein